MTGPALAEGSNGVKAALTEDHLRPPWMDVDPRAVVERLTQQLAGMLQQLAMQDAYIAQLHQALAQLTGALPQEDSPQAG